MDEPQPKAAAYFIAGQGFAAPPLAPGLYVVATPIGNLRDITIRALETLAAVDAVLCEDTRMSARLLDHYAIKGRRIALHEHNERAKADDIVARVAAGQSFALISDAGTPLLSDPGFPLIRALAEAGLPVFAIPGASALLSALVVAGLPTDAFAFHGFLPPKAGARANALKALLDSRETLVFYESPRRLDDSLAAMALAFGPTRAAAVALELTKRFERVHRGTLGELAAEFAASETRGEAVIVVAGAPDAATPDAADWTAALAEALADQPLRAAVDAITARYALKRKQVYDAALALKSENSKRIAAQLGGHRGEALAAWFLRLQFYRIIATRYKTPVGEIDLIAIRFGVTVFVEVKARNQKSAEAEALEAVNTSRIARAAQYWLARHPAQAETPFRFDVIFLAPRSWPRHVVNAFDAF